MREGEEYRCSLHQEHGLGYLAWHRDAEEREARGEVQIHCPECGRWVWPNLFYEPVTQQKGTNVASEEGSCLGSQT